jgi:hypothetical protein
MAKLYKKSIAETVKPPGPKEETLKFLLNYSRALSVCKYKNMTFETLNN